MNPQLPRLPLLPNINAPEFLEAAKSAKRAADAIAGTADKWGQVADVLLSWQTLGVFAAGVAVGTLFYALLRKR